MDRVIATERLDLVALSPDVHRALLDGDYRRAGRLLGAHGLCGLTLPREVLELRLEQLTSRPQLENWLLRAMVLRETNEVVGNIGFHAAPDASYLLEQGLEGLEYGYTVFEEHRRKGYAKEASLGLMDWAFTKRHVNMFVLSIQAENTASIALAHSLRFSEEKEYVHPDRGNETIFTLDYPSR